MSPALATSFWSSMCAPQEFQREGSVSGGHGSVAFFTPCNYTFLCPYLLTSVFPAALHKGRLHWGGQLASCLAPMAGGKKVERSLHPGYNVCCKGCARPTLPLQQEHRLFWSQRRLSWGTLLEPILLKPRGGIRSLLFARKE